MGGKARTQSASSIASMVAAAGKVPYKAPAGKVPTRSTSAIASMSAAVKPPATLAQSARAAVVGMMSSDPGIGPKGSIGTAKA